MARPAWQRRMTSAVRRTGAYQGATARALPAIRGSAGLRGLTDRVLPRSHYPGATPFALLAGAGLGGPDVDRLPVVILDATRVALTDVPAMLDSVAQTQRERPVFRPVVVTAGADFGAVRAHGYVADPVIARDAWRSAWGDWDDYVARRLVSLTAGYRALATLEATPAGLSESAGRTLDALAAELRHVDLDVSSTPRDPA